MFRTARQSSRLNLSPDSTHRSVSQGAGAVNVFVVIRPLPSDGRPTKCGSLHCILGDRTPITNCRWSRAAVGWEESARLQPRLKAPEARRQCLP